MPKLQCSKSGLWYAVTTNHKRELVEKFEADGKNLDTDYVSRDARRLMKEGNTEDQIRAMVENGELTSKTSAPKRAPKSESQATSTPTPAPVSEDTPEPERSGLEDPDIAGFMGGEVPEGDASSKAV